MEQSCMRRRHTKLTPGVMICETISYSTKSTLVVITSTMTANLYVRLMIEQVKISYERQLIHSPFYEHQLPHNSKNDVKEAETRMKFYVKANFDEKEAYIHENLGRLIGLVYRRSRTGRAAIDMQYPSDFSNRIYNTPNTTTVTQRALQNVHIFP